MNLFCIVSAYSYLCTCNTYNNVYEEVRFGSADYFCGASQ